MSWLILLALLKKLDKKIDDLETVTFRKVDELPATGEANVIYFVPKETAEEGNYSDEYIWDSASESYEQIGDSMIDPLPEVTAADNGKVLGVANGEWGKVDGTKIKFYETIISSGNRYLTNNKKGSDILTDIDNGYIVYIYAPNKIGGLFHAVKLTAVLVGLYGRWDTSYNEIGTGYINANDSRVYYYSRSLLNIPVKALPRIDTVDDQRLLGVNSSGDWALMNNNIAPAFKYNNLYEVGDMVTYNGKLYICIVAKTVAGSFKPANWLQIMVSDELYKKANLTDIPADANPNIADIYDATATYELGDLCIYNDILYECTTAISTAEAWDSTHWTAKTVAEELEGKADISDIPADANHNIASAYDSTATYAVGDLCIYNGNLYECSTAISTAEAWDSTHWTQKTVAQELTNAGGSVVIFNGSIVSFQGLKFSLSDNKTCGDIRKALLDGKTVFLKDSNSHIYNLYAINLANSTFIFKEYCEDYNGRITINTVSASGGVSDSATMIPFASTAMVKIAPANSSDIGKVLMANSSGNWVAADIPTELPSVTSSDEGKVLTVNSNGEWVASALPDGTNQQY